MLWGPCCWCSYWSSLFALVDLCLRPWWLCSRVPYWLQYKCHKLPFSWRHSGSEFSLILVFFPFYSYIPTLVLTTFPSKFSLLFRSMRSLFGLWETSNWSGLSTPDSCTVVRMLMMMMVVMVLKGQSRLQAISRGRGISDDLVER